mmetsp:Transcript_1795/g.6254  ORF Transcript_1795/g.6254 Transcript_1795/m.6254 type:complete len:204 (-) Transcript_1795:1091-1702(-)
MARSCTSWWVSAQPAARPRPRPRCISGARLKKSFIPAVSASSLTAGLSSSSSASSTASSWYGASGSAWPYSPSAHASAALAWGSATAARSRLPRATTQSSALSGYRRRMSFTTTRASACTWSDPMSRNCSRRSVMPAASGHPSAILPTACTACLDRASSTSATYSLSSVAMSYAFCASATVVSASSLRLLTAARSLCRTKNDL